MMLDAGPTPGSHFRREAAVIVEPDLRSLLERVRETIRKAGTETHTDRPSVTLAFAQSFDGCIAAEVGSRTQIGCAEAHRFTHALCNAQAQSWSA